MCYMCPSCHSSYPVIGGVIDFRDPARDVSSGYDIERDNLIAAKMDEVFDQVETFNEMLKLYEGLRRRQASGFDLLDICPRDVLKEDRILPQHFSDADAEHGRAVMAKIMLYNEGTGLPSVPTGIALEDGAGPGYFIVGLSERFEHLFVLDLSMAYLVLARKVIGEKGLNNVTLICASAERLPFANQSIDFVHNNNVIEHVLHQEQMIAETHRIISENGLVFIMSPNRFSIYFEPHFGLPGYGFFPRFLRRLIVRRWRNQNIDDIRLLSLTQLRKMTRKTFGSEQVITFLPRRLSDTTSGGLIRNVITRAMNLPVIDDLANFILNRLALGIMPYHVVLAARAKGAKAPRRSLGA